EAGLFAVLAATAQRFWLPLILALVLADGAIAIVGRALTRAALSAVLKPAGALAAGNKLLNVLFSLGYATGPAVGGAVVATAGVQASLVTTAGLFGVMAVTLATARTLPAASGDADHSWSERLRDGIA